MIVRERSVWDWVGFGVKKKKEREKRMRKIGRGEKKETENTKNEILLFSFFVRLKKYFY